MAFGLNEGVNWYGEFKTCDSWIESDIHIEQTCSNFIETALM